MREVWAHVRDQVVRATRATTTHDGTIHACDGGQDSFLGSIQTTIGECAVNNKSCEYALRLCSVPLRGARRAPFSRPYHNRRVGCLMLCRQRDNLLERHFRATDHRSRAYRVTTCRLWLTFVSGLDHYNVTILPREITTNIKHVLPALLLETSTFSAVSLKTLLVLIHRRILRPSRSAAWRISGSPNLITASRNGLRRCS